MQFPNLWAYNDPRRVDNQLIIFFNEDVLLQNSYVHPYIRECTDIAFLWIIIS